MKQSGTGTGTVAVASVTPSQAGTGHTGLTCTSSSLLCQGQFDYGRPLTVTATPDAGAAFTQWTGACAGQGATCTIAPTAATSTNAVFGLASQAATATTTATTTTTTPATHTTTTTTTSTPTTTTSPGLSHVLEAQLIAVNSGRSLLGLRIDKVEVQASETLTATLVLTRSGKHLARTSIAGIQRGDRVLTLPIRDSVSKGKATLIITLTDTAGNHRTAVVALLE